MPDKLKTLENIIELLERENPSFEEVADVIRVVLERIEALRQEMAKNMAEMGKMVNGEHQNMMVEMDKEMERMKQRLEALRQSAIGDNQSVMKQLVKEVNRLEGMIPEKTDLTEIYAKLKEVESKIPEIPEIPKELDAEGIVSKINRSEELIDRERIKDLEDLIKELRKEIKTLSGAKGSPRRIFQPYLDDFSSQTDGSTKIFYLSREPLKSETVLVWGTDFPIILRPTTDFTISGKTLTLTSAVPAPNSGATLLVRYDA